MVFNKLLQNVSFLSRGGGKSSSAGGSGADLSGVVPRSSAVGTLLSSISVPLTESSVVGLPTVVGGKGAPKGSGSNKGK